MKIANFLLLCASCSAFSVSTRREVWQQAGKTLVASLVVTGTTYIPQPPSAQALEACLRGSQNCIRTSWTAPEKLSKAEMVDTIMGVINSYPQEGQAGVDNNGYTVAENTLADKGYARVEYRNFGNFAKFLNGGRPFVDDLEVELTDSNTVQVKSSSRIGESDLGVNQKRLLYIGKALKAQGWAVSEPRY